MKKTKQTNEEKELMKMKKAELVDLVQIYKGTVDLVESDSRNYINKLEAGMALERTTMRQEKSSLKKRLYTQYWITTVSVTFTLILWLLTWFRG